MNELELVRLKRVEAENSVHEGLKLFEMLLVESTGTLASDVIDAAALKKRGWKKSTIDRYLNAYSIRTRDGKKFYLRRMIEEALGANKFFIPGHYVYDGGRSFSVVSNGMISMPPLLREQLIVGKLVA
jgi:hypothetical protein